MSLDEYEKLVAENEASDTKEYALKDKYGINGKFDQIISVTDAEKSRMGLSG